MQVGMEGYMGPCYAAGAMNPLGTAFNGVMNEASFQYAASGSQAMKLLVQSSDNE